MADRSHSELDLAYAAGLFDGEGCIYVAAHDRFRLRVQVGMVERAGTTWLHENFGGKLQVKKSQNKNWRAQTVWCLSCKQAAMFLELILPYMKLKHEQAELALEREARKGPVGSGKLSEQELVARGVLADEIKRLKWVV